MFDLNEQIAKWRSGLAESEKCSKADIDELESHLREEIDNLTPAGLSQQEAFVVAKGRLGDTASLENEFAKVNGGYMFRNRVFWMVAGAFAYLVAKFSAEASGYAGALIGSLASLEPSTSAVIGLATGVLGFGVVLLLFCLACSPNANLLRFNGFRGRRRGKVIILTFLVTVVPALIGVKILFTILIARTVGASYYGSMHIFSLPFSLAFSILLPVVLAVVLIKLRLSRYRAARR